MEKIPAAMVRDHLRDIPDHALPAGYSLRTFRRGEELAWAEVNFAAGSFDSVEAALERWRMEFADHADEMEDRCFFLVHNEDSRVIGTTTAWYDRDFQGEDYGRIHWVAIHPDSQGRKLAKPMLSAAMRRLAQSHDRAYLWTNTACWKAISMYLDFGFTPILINSSCEDAWRILAGRTDHPGLERFR